MPRMEHARAPRVNPHRQPVRTWPGIAPARESRRKAAGDGSYPRESNERNSYHMYIYSKVPGPLTRNLKSRSSDCDFFILGARENTISYVELSSLLVQENTFFLILK